MKIFKTILIAIAILISFPNDAEAQQENSEYKMVLKTNPMAALGGPFWVTVIPVTGEYRLMYEIKTSAKQSASVGASYLGPSLILNLDNLTTDSANISGITTSGYKLQVMYKFYLSRDEEAPRGFYLAPHVSYAKASIVSNSNSNDRADAIKLNVNGLIGYQLISSGGFALDIYTGLGLKVVDWGLTGDAGDIFEFGVGKTTPTVAFGVNFGYAF